MHLQTQNSKKRMIDDKDNQTLNTAMNPRGQLRHHADYLKANFTAKFYMLYFASHYISTADCLSQTFMKNKYSFQISCNENSKEMKDKFCNINNPHPPPRPHTQTKKRLTNLSTSSVYILPK